MCRSVRADVRFWENTYIYVCTLEVLNECKTLESVCSLTFVRLFIHKKSPLMITLAIDLD